MALVAAETRPPKRARVDESDEAADAPAVPRSSKLEAPIMLLQGHESAVMALKFDPTGRYLATGSHDKTIMLWEVYGSCTNFNVLQGHKNVVGDLAWTASGNKLVSASADKTCGVWDIERGTRLRKFAAHAGFVNSVDTPRDKEPVFVSGGDDCLTAVWDMRAKRRAQGFESPFQVTAVALSGDGELVFSGGIDNVVRAWDRRTESVAFELAQHTDTITGLAVSPDGGSLLSNAMDRRLISWDVRAFSSAATRVQQTFVGHEHNMEKTLLKCSWSPDGEMVSAGSSNCMVHVWDVPTGEELYRLPGHGGSVNEVSFHPNEPIVGSCSNDKQIYLGELQTPSY